MKGWPFEPFGGPGINPCGGEGPGSGGFPG